MLDISSNQQTLQIQLLEIQNPKIDWLHTLIKNVVPQVQHNGLKSSIIQNLVLPFKVWFNYFIKMS